MRQQPVLTLLRSRWHSFKDKLWYFAPGPLCRVLVWGILVVSSAGLTYWGWQREYSNQARLLERQGERSRTLQSLQLLSDTSARTKLTPALTLPLPARVSALQGGLILNRETTNQPAGWDLRTSVLHAEDQWSGLIWIEQLATRHGVTVNLLEHAEAQDASAQLPAQLPAQPSAQERRQWVSYRAELASNPQSFTRFMTDLAAGAAFVRLLQFSIDPIEGEAELFLSYNLDGPQVQGDGSVSWHAGSMVSVLQPLSFPAMAAKETGASQSLKILPGECVHCEEVSDVGAGFASGRVTVQRDEGTHLWRLQADGAVTRVPPVHSGVASEASITPWME